MVSINILTWTGGVIDQSLPVEFRGFGKKSLKSKAQVLQLVIVLGCKQFVMEDYIHTQQS